MCPHGPLLIRQGTGQWLAIFTAAVERVAFDKEYLKKEPTLEWITPEHPLFETVRHRRVSAPILSNIVLSLCWSALSLRPVGASGAK